MKLSDLRSMSVEELIQKKNDLMKDLVKYRVQKVSNTPNSNTMLVSNAKKDIARINLILREKQLAKSKN